MNLKMLRVDRKKRNVGNENQLIGLAAWDRWELNPLKSSNL